MYFKAHGHHWNVEGKDFSQLHDFFANLYQELFAAVDQIAEQIRALDDYAPYGLDTMSSIATIKDSSFTGDNIPLMLQDLMEANASVIEALNAAHKLAEAEGNRGLVNHIEGRLDVHAKHAWMLLATSK
jgi:starvation-inducible DNA-binding protein